MSTVLNEYMVMMMMMMVYLGNKLSLQCVCDAWMLFLGKRDDVYCVSNNFNYNYNYNYSYNDYR